VTPWSVAKILDSTKKYEGSKSGSQKRGASMDPPVFVVIPDGQWTLFVRHVFQLFAGNNRGHSVKKTVFNYRWLLSTSRSSCHFLWVTFVWCTFWQNIRTHENPSITIVYLYLLLKHTHKRFASNSVSILLASRSGECHSQVRELYCRLFFMP
jgi:hypothetical protein